MYKNLINNGISTTYLYQLVSLPDFRDPSTVENLWSRFRGFRPPTLVNNSVLVENMFQVSGATRMYICKSKPDCDIIYIYIWYLVGAFNPFEKYLSNLIIFPGRGNKKHLKPPPRIDIVIGNVDVIVGPRSTWCNSCLLLCTTRSKNSAFSAWNPSNIYFHHQFHPWNPVKKIPVSFRLEDPVHQTYLVNSKIHPPHHRIIVKMLVPLGGYTQ